MAYSNKSRTLRHGSLVVKDGSSTPISLTVVCDDGDLSWTERQEIQEIRCRGNLQEFRKGDEQPCELSFTVHWMQLIQKSVTSGDPAAFYEMVNNTGDTFNSTVAGDLHFLDYEFTVVDPADTANCDELIVFSDVTKTEMSPQEGEMNKISFNGRSLHELPTISRV